MKKSFRSSFVFAVCAAALASCSYEIDQVSAFKTYLACTDGEASTKTSLDGVKVLWSAGDQVIGLCSAASDNATAQIPDGDDGKASVSLSLPANALYAAYPAAGTSYADGKIHATLPAVQYVVAGSFAKGSSLAVAKAVPGSDVLKFRNACAFISVDIKNDGIKSVSISADMPLVGDVELTFSGDVPVAVSAPGASSGDVLLKKEDGSALAQGLYYIPVLPGTYASVTMVFDDGSRTATFTSSRGLTLLRNDNVTIFSKVIGDDRWAAKMSGSGNLYHGGTSRGLDGGYWTGHAYSWSMSGTTISIDVDVDANYYADHQAGSWELGLFELPKSSFQQLTGADVSTLTENEFKCYYSDGTQAPEMTSYKPGMWLSPEGLAGYDGVFWQWFVWNSYYDYDNLPGYMIIGLSPGNIDLLSSGKPIVSRSVISVDGTDYDFVVTVNFHWSAVCNRYWTYYDEVSESWIADEPLSGNVNIKYSTVTQKYTLEGWYGVEGYDMVFSTVKSGDMNNWVVDTDLSNCIRTVPGDGNLEVYFYGDKYNWMYPLNASSNVQGGVIGGRAHVDMFNDDGVWCGYVLYWGTWIK